jgi:phage gp36-like protein
MGKYHQQADLENAMGVQFVVGCFDDNGDGVADAAPVAACIARSEGLVDAYLCTEIVLPLAVPSDRLVVEACIEYSTSFAMDRRPEYARRFGDDGGSMRDSHYTRARKILLDVKAAQIELPDNEALEPAGNTGAIVYDNSSRMMIDSASGTSNAGDF